jgi:hypothetical protein
MRLVSSLFVDKSKYPVGALEWTRTPQELWWKLLAYPMEKNRRVLLAVTTDYLAIAHVLDAYTGKTYVLHFPVGMDWPARRHENLQIQWRAFSDNTAVMQYSLELYKKWVQQVQGRKSIFHLPEKSDTLETLMLKVRKQEMQAEQQRNAGNGQGKLLR